ncbi:MAG: hypothetical protein U9N19_02705 [Thermodesulfobacteriota bacterium]|nr:hypothetical protein [Thermodesulfobacteriota bacterium]
MKIFVLFAPRFLEWPLAIAHRLSETKNISIMGLATGTRDVFERVSASSDPVISPLDFLDDLERQWLSTPFDEKRARRHEKRLGPGITGRIITADRQVGIGLVGGGVIPETSLIKITKDFEMIRRYVGGLLGYFFDILESNKPDLVLCYGVAGSVALSLSQVAGCLNIPFRMFMHARIGGRRIIDDSPKNIGLLAPAGATFEKALNNPLMLAHALPEARRYLEQFRSKTVPPDYMFFHQKALKKKLQYKSIFSNATKDLARVVYRLLRRPVMPLRSVSPWALFKHNFLTSIRARGLIKDSLFVKPEELPKAGFAYFPLHMEPEASTMVIAPMHSNQMAIIEALAKSLPLDMYLLVKEHTPMLGLRPKGFYERLSRIPRVFLASPYMDSASLIKKAALTCVITGTAAWEAILLEKPALIVGDSPFLAIGEGYVHCRDVTKLPWAIDKAINLAPVGDERLTLYLAALFDQSFDFPRESFWGDVTEDTVSENPEILDNICKRLMNSCSGQDCGNEK